MLEAGYMRFELEESDLAAIVHAIKQELYGLLKDKSLTLKIMGTELDVRARFDTKRMMQVVRNLLSNAIKFTPEGKKITVILEMTELPAGSSGGEKGTVPAISLTVSDEGIGIPEDELETVFDRFTQSSKTRTEAGGTGLGLAICKEIITGHGGCIHALNNPDGGARVTFIIPLGFTE
jgi:signal transduction histidine kinase